MFDELWESNEEVYLKNIVIMGIEGDIFLEFTQVLIDNCPLNKYTYDSLKHIYEIGFKTRK